MNKDKKMEFVRLGIANAVGLCVMYAFIWISPHYQPSGDSMQVYRYFVFEIPKGIWLCILMGSSASIINFAFKGDWWDELKCGNVAVGVATLGLWIGLGIALHKGL